MILYTDDVCGFLRWHGSVAPHALLWAIPAAGLAVAYSYFLEKHDLKVDGPPEAPQTTAWALFTSILGFLVVFRAQLAYNRYWEGITLVEQACAVWLNGVSNLIAFCSEDPDKHIHVATFQHLLSRLMSLLFRQSMSDISKLDSSRFSCLDLEALDTDSLNYLETQEAKHAIVLQWIQRLVVENARTGTLDIAPPILSRVFQELSIGIMHIVSANKLTTVPFPFQFAQMVWIMICIFSILFMPYISARHLPLPESALYTFVTVFTFWSVHYISVEIEQPFGEDPNDLPLDMTSDRFNRSLIALLEQRAQVTPQLVRATMEVNHHANRVSKIGEDMVQSKHSRSRVFTEIRARLLKGSSRGNSFMFDGSVGTHRGFLQKTMSRLTFLSRTSETSEDSGQGNCQATPIDPEGAPTRFAPTLGAANADSEEQRSWVSEASIFDQFLFDPSSPSVSGPCEPLAPLREVEAECSVSRSVTSSASLEEDERAEVSEASVFDQCPRDPSLQAVSGPGEPIAPRPEAEVECSGSRSATSAGRPDEEAEAESTGSRSAFSSVRLDEEAEVECSGSRSATGSPCLDEVEESPRAPQRSNFPMLWSSGDFEDARVAASPRSYPRDQRFNAGCGVLEKPAGLPDGGRLAETGLKRPCLPVFQGSGSPRHRLEPSALDRSHFSSQGSRESRNSRAIGQQVSRGGGSPRPQRQVSQGGGSPRHRRELPSSDRGNFSSSNSRESRDGRMNGQQAPVAPLTQEVNVSGNDSPICPKDGSQFSSLESGQSRASRGKCHPMLAEAL